MLYYWLSFVLGIAFASALAWAFWEWQMLKLTRKIIRAVVDGLPDSGHETMTTSTTMEVFQYFEDMTGLKPNLGRIHAAADALAAEGQIRVSFRQENGRTVKVLHSMRKAGA